MVDFNYLAWIAAFSTLFGFISYMVSRIIFDFVIRRKMYFWAGAAFPVGINAMVSYYWHLTPASFVAVIVVSVLFGLLSGYIPDRILNHIVSSKH